MVPHGLDCVALALPVLLPAEPGARRIHRCARAAPAIRVRALGSAASVREHERPLLVHATARQLARPAAGGLPLRVWRSAQSISYFILPRS